MARAILPLSLLQTWNTLLLLQLELPGYTPLPPPWPLVACVGYSAQPEAQLS